MPAHFQTGCSKLCCVNASFCSISRRMQVAVVVKMQIGPAKRLSVNRSVLSETGDKLEALTPSSLITTRRRFLFLFLVAGGPARCLGQIARKKRKKKAVIFHRKYISQQLSRTSNKISRYYAGICNLGTFPSASLFFLSPLSPSCSA